MAQICDKSLPCQGIPVAVLLWLVWEMSELHLPSLEEERQRVEDAMAQEINLIDTKLAL